MFVSPKVIQQQQQQQQQQGGGAVVDFNPKLSLEIARPLLQMGMATSVENDIIAPLQLSSRMGFQIKTYDIITTKSMR